MVDLEVGPSNSTARAEDAMEVDPMATSGHIHCKLPLLTSLQGPNHILVSRRSSVAALRKRVRQRRAFCCRFCDQRSSSKGSIGFLVASTIYACLKLLLCALFTIQMYVLVSNRGLRDGWSWYFSFYLFIWSLYFAFLVTPAR